MRSPRTARRSARPTRVYADSSLNLTQSIEPCEVADGNQPFGLDQLANGAPGFEKSSFRKDLASNGSPLWILSDARMRSAANQPGPPQSRASISSVESVAFFYFQNSYKRTICFLAENFAALPCLA